MARTDADKSSAREKDDDFTRVLLDRGKRPCNLEESLGIRNFFLVGRSELRSNFVMSNFPVIEHLCHAPNQVFLLVLILGVSGFVSGLTGFGFGMVGVAVLWILPPREGVPLVMLLSACSQIISMVQLRSSMPPLRAWWPDGPAPCILGGLLGMPLGLWLLSHLNANVVSTGIGLVIVGTSLWMMIRAALPGFHTLKRTLRTALSAGFLGGIIGGVSANPGPVMIIWSNLLGLDKNQQRAIVQPFILSMQVLALGFFVVRGGVFSGCLLILWISSFLVIVLTTRLGVLAFRKLSNHDFNRMVQILLIVSGISLIAKGSSVWVSVLAKLDHHIFLF